MKKFFRKFGGTFIGILLLFFGIRANIIDLCPASAHSFSRPVELVVLLVLVLIAVVGLVFLRLRTPAFIAGVIAAVYLVQLIMPYDAINGANEGVVRVFAMVQMFLGTFILGIRFKRFYESLETYEEETDEEETDEEE